MEDGQQRGSQTRGNRTSRRRDYAELDDKERKKFRSLAATLKFMSLGRSNVQYTTRAICTQMAANQKRRMEDVDEVPRGSTCSNCGVVGHIAKVGYAKGKGKTMEGAGKKGSCKSEGHKGGLSGESKSWGYQGQSWTCGRAAHASAECRWRVAGVEQEEPTAEEVEDNLCQRCMEKSEECGSSGMWRKKKAQAARGADPSTGHTKIDVMGYNEIREDRDDVFVQSSKRKTCNRQERTDDMTSASRSN